MIRPAFGTRGEDFLESGHGNYGEGSPAELSRIQDAVRAYLRGDTVYFIEFLHRRQWEWFVEGCGDRPGRVWLTAELPPSWPRPPEAQIRVWDEWFQSQARQFWRIRHRCPVVYQRRADGLTHEWCLTYGAWQSERESCVQMLEGLGLLDRSHYSRPQHRPDLTMPITPESTDVRRPGAPRRIFTLESGTEWEERFQHRTNVLRLRPAGQSCHAWVVIDNFPFNPDMSGAVSEKILYPVLMGIPFLYVGNPHQCRRILDLGFEPAEPCRASERGLAEQMLYLRQIFRDPQWAQQWQELQGNRISHNLRVLERLANLPTPAELQ